MLTAAHLCLHYNVKNNEKHAHAHNTYWTPGSLEHDQSEPSAIIIDLFTY